MAEDGDDDARLTSILLTTKPLTPQQRRAVRQKIRRANRRHEELLAKSGKPKLHRERRTTSQVERRNPLGHSQFDGPDLAAEFEKLKLSQKQFARITGVQESVIRRYCQPGAHIPQWVDLILEYIRLRPELALLHRGTRGPNPRTKLTEEKKPEALKMLEDGKSDSEVARYYSVNRSTILRLRRSSQTRL